MTMMSSQTAKVTLPTDRTILIRREFAAPAALVWKAWTTPELVRRWWHANRGEVAVCEIDLRVGGAWRFVMAAQGGMEVAFRGEYQEVVPHERLVSTEVFEPVPHAQSLNTLTLTEAGGRTTAELLIEHTSKVNRDAQVDSGMEDGLQDALDLLEQVAVSLD